MYRPKWPFLLRYGSRDTRRIDFLRVDGLSTDILVLGRHSKPSFGGFMLLEYYVLRLIALKNLSCWKILS